MKKILFAMMLCAAVAACKKDEAAPVDAAPADATAVPADAAPADATAVPADGMPTDAAAMPADATTAPVETAAAGALPVACEDYFKRAEACFNKSGASGAAMKSAFDQSRTQMAQVPAAQMEMGCKAANDAFAQTAAALKCE